MGRGGVGKDPSPPPARPNPRTLSHLTLWPRRVGLSASYSALPGASSDEGTMIVPPGLKPLIIAIWEREPYKLQPPDLSKQRRA